MVQDRDGEKTQTVCDIETNKIKKTLHYSASSSSLLSLSLSKTHSKEWHFVCNLLKVLTVPSVRSIYIFHFCLFHYFSHPSNTFSSLRASFFFLMPLIHRVSLPLYHFAPWVVPNISCCNVKIIWKDSAEENELDKDEKLPTRICSLYNNQHWMQRLLNT